MKHICAALLLLLLVNTVTAQTLQGTVRNAQQQPLPFCTVFLLEAGDSSLVKGTLSNEQGIYHFDHLTANNYLLKIQMMGYVSQIITVHGSTQDVVLQATTAQLQGVTVKGAKPMIEQHTDRTIFNIENSSVAAGNNAMEVLQMAPLVSNTQNGLRLKGKDNVMVLIDGKITPGAALSDILGSMPAEQIVKIELITSPSAKYDASAAGGVINIITKKGSGMGLNGMANASLGQGRYGRYSAGINLNYRQGKFNIYGNLNTRDAHAYKSESLNRLLDETTYRAPSVLYGHGVAQTGKIGVDYALTSHSVIGIAIDGLYSHADNRLETTSSFSQGNAAPDSTLYAHTQPGHNTNFGAYNINYQNTFDNKGRELSADFTYSHFNGVTRQDLAADLQYADGSKPVTHITGLTRTGSDIQLTTLQTDYTQALGAHTTLEAGAKEVHTQSANTSLNQSENAHTNDSSFTTAYHENVLAAYATLTHNWKSLKVQAGLRAEQLDATLNTGNISRHNLDMFPSALIEKTFSDDYQLGLSFTSQVNRPAYESLIPFVIPIDLYTQEKGNPNLLPEYIHSLVLSSKLKNISLSVDYTFTTDAINDFIIQEPGTKIWSFTKGNFTRMQSYTATAVLPVSVTKWWNSTNTLMGGYSSWKYNAIHYSRGSYSYSVNTLNSFTLPQGFKAELSAYYNSPSLSGLYSLSHYSAVNAGISKSFLHGKLNAKAGVNDIFHDMGYHLKLDAGSIHSSGFSFTDSRRFTLSASYKFGRKIAPARQKNNAAETEQGRLGI